MSFLKPLRIYLEKLVSNATLKSNPYFLAFALQKKENVLFKFKPRLSVTHYHFKKYKVVQI
jgi:hypothetical protein